MKETADLLNDRRYPGAPVAPEGFTFTAFDHVAKVEREFTVGPPCKSQRIRWYCVTHSLAFSYQGQMGEHTAHRGVRECLLVAICFEHKGRPETVTVPTRRRRSELQAEASR